MTDVVVRVQFNIVGKSLELLLNELQSFEPSETKFSLLKSCLIVFNFFLGLAEPDVDETRVSEVQEMVAYRLCEFVG